MATPKLPLTSRLKQTAVARAARLMDREVPGWYQRVNLSTLAMGSCTHCLLGQTFGTSVETAIAKELFPEEWAATALAYVRTCYSEKQWNAFTEERRQEILNNQNGYAIGRLFFQRRHGAVPASLEAACSGSFDACKWAEEIATRRAANEQQKEQTAHE